FGNNNNINIFNIIRYPRLTHRFRSESFFVYNDISLNSNLTPSIIVTHYVEAYCTAERHSLIRFFIYKLIIK
ncbi:Carboxypeptidase vitellogenic like, partial [Aphis craccivora]